VLVIFRPRGSYTTPSRGVLDRIFSPENQVGSMEIVLVDPLVMTGE